MLRKDIIKGFEQLQAAISECGIDSLIGEHSGKPRKGGSTSQIDSFREWILRSQTFNEAAQAILDVFRLDVLRGKRIPFWEILLSEPGDPELQETYNWIIRFKAVSPGLVELLKQDVDLSPVEKGKPEKRKHEVLSALVVEERGFSSPARISTLMTSVQLLYEVSAELNEMSPTDLCLISCDSGSDKSFDFLGAAKIIEQIRKIILDLWDRVIFYRERKLYTHLDIVSKSLPIMEQIDTLEKNGTLGPEQAGKMRRDISEGVRKFLDSGAIIPEMEKRSSVSPRQLMAPAPKLLVSDTQDQASNDKGKNKSKTKRKGTRKTKGKDEEKAKEAEQMKSSIMEDSQLLKNQVEKAVKEALEKERAAKKSEDASPHDKREKTEGDAHQTDTADKQ